jgi:glycosyltransferase involved in cell wall biosynthesis
MRIAIISHLKFAIREPFKGGLEMHTFQLTKALRKRGHQVDLFAARGSDPSLNLKDVSVFDLNYKNEQFPEPNYEHFSEQFVQEHHAYLDILKRIEYGNYDVIHNNCLNYLPITLAHTIKTPMVTVLHTPPFSWLQSAVKHESRYNRIKYLSVSQKNSEVWAPYKKDLEVVYNGIDLKNWELGLSPEKDRVIWFGRIAPEKGTHLALEAIHKAGKKAWIVGSIYDRAYYENKVKPLLQGEDEMIGHLNHSQLNEYIKRSESFCCTPVWDEPFGLVVAEALACGTPVAAFNKGAMSEILNEKVGCLIEPENTDKMAEGLIRVAKLDRRECREHIRSNFNLDKMIDRYEEVYQREINRINNKSEQVKPIWKKAG